MTVQKKKKKKREEVQLCTFRLSQRSHTSLSDTERQCEITTVMDQVLICVVNGAAAASSVSSLVLPCFSPAWSLIMLIDILGIERRTLIESAGVLLYIVSPLVSVFLVRLVRHAQNTFRTKPPH